MCALFVQGSGRGEPVAHCGVRVISPDSCDFGAWILASMVMSFTPVLSLTIFISIFERGIVKSEDGDVRIEALPAADRRACPASHARPLMV